MKKILVYMIKITFTITENLELIRYLDFNENT